MDVALPYLDSELPETRIQAALTLGIIGDPGTLSAVARLLSDQAPVVRVAAAAAVLRMLS